MKPSDFSGQKHDNKPCLILRISALNNLTSYVSITKALFNYHGIFQLFYLLPDFTLYLPELHKLQILNGIIRLNSYREGLI